jgi:hypothetical protein
VNQARVSPRAFIACSRPRSGCRHAATGRRSRGLSSRQGRRLPRSRSRIRTAPRQGPRARSRGASRHDPRARREPGRRTRRSRRTTRPARGRETRGATHGPKTPRRHRAGKRASPRPRPRSHRRDEARAGEHSLTVPWHRGTSRRTATRTVPGRPVRPAPPSPLRSRTYRRIRIRRAGRCRRGFEEPWSRQAPLQRVCRTGAARIRRVRDDGPCPGQGRARPGQMKAATTSACSPGRSKSEARRAARSRWARHPSGRGACRRNRRPGRS